MDTSINCVDNDPSSSSTPKSTVNNDNIITTGTQDSPWLSKPRRSDIYLSLSSSTKRNLSFKMEKDNITVPLRNVSKCLDNFELKWTAEQLDVICDLLQAKNDDDEVALENCVTVLTNVFGVEMELKGIALDELKFSLQYGSDGEQIFQLKMLKNENKELRYQIQVLKQLLKEERTASCETEKELYTSRKNIQMLINDRRQLQVELSNGKSRRHNETPETNVKESQTEIDEELLNEKKNMKKLAVTCRLYQLSTEKLLEFTKVVHEMLTQYKSNLPANGSEKTLKTKNNLFRQPAKVKRAASIQNITGDVSNYFVRKFGDGGRVSRAASVCNVRAQTSSENFDILERLANKAKEISSTIESILSENDTANPRPEKVEWV